MGKNWRRGKSKKVGVTTNNTTSRRLWSDYARLGTWKAVAGEYGVTAGMAFRVANGYEPKRAAIRTALRMPAFQAVEVCPVHGVAHTTKRCPAAPKPDYDAWKTANLPALNEMVAWAEGQH